MTIRWGVLSTGRIAEQFAQDFRFVEGGEIVAVSSRTVANARKFADQFGIGTVHAAAADLYADPQVDAIYIATPHTLHLQNTLDSIAAGKAVLCEKPLTTNVEDCLQISAAADRQSVYVMEAMWTWFLPAIREAKRWLDAGRIGRLVQIKVDFGYPQRPYSPDRREYDARLGGGALLEMGIYPVALLWLFLGRQPDNLEVMSRHAPNGVEDDLTAILDFGDCLATIGTSFRSKMQNCAYLIGEDGYIAIPDFWRANECLLFELDECKERFCDDRESIGLNFETQAVIDDLAVGLNASPVVSLNDSLAFQQMMARIRNEFSR
jgi:predicted dehydrogenase